MRFECIDCQKLFKFNSNEGVITYDDDDSDIMFIYCNKCYKKKDKED